MKYYLFIAAVIASIGMFTSCDPTDSTPVLHITGTVLDTKTGSPLSDVAVVLGSLQTQTEADGTFELEVTENPGASVISFNKEGYMIAKYEFVYSHGKGLNLNPVLLEKQASRYQIMFTVSEYPVNMFEGIYYVGFHAETEVEVHSTANWVTAEFNSPQDIRIIWQQNITTEQRTAYIILKSTIAEISDTLTITQSAGPALTVLDYTGKDEKPLQPGETPFLRFNRSVKLESILYGVKTSNLIYEEDSTVIRFPDIQSTLLQPIRYEYLVKSRDEQFLGGTFQVIPPNRIAFHYAEDVLFSKGNRYCWVQAFKIDNYTNLSQIETGTNRMIQTIQIGTLSPKFCYSPYNNCIYAYDYNIKVFNADNGTKEAEIELPEAIRGQKIVSMDFAYNGTGVLLTSNHLYTIDASDNHRMVPYTCNSDLYNGPNQEADKLRFNKVLAANNRKSLVLFLQESIYEVAVIDADSRNYQTVYTRRESDGFWSDCRTHKREPYIWLHSWQYNNILLVNLLTGETTSYPYYRNDYGELTYPLPVESTIPWKGVVFINNHQLVGIRRESGMPYVAHYIEDGRKWGTYSSDDGSMIAVTTYNHIHLLDASLLVP